VSTTLHETQPPVPALEIQMLRLYCNLLDEDRKQQLLDYAQTLIEDQRAERGEMATVPERGTATVAERGTAATV
jgi:hypothetical protein